MLRKLKNLLWKSEGHEDLVTPTNVNVSFKLMYNTLLIGTLNLKEGIWTFAYSDEFKQQNKIKPLTDFPRVDKVYQNMVLYPFFLHRIPGLNQPKVKATIEKEKIDKTNEAELLKRFGQISITNPFLLKPI